MSSEKVSCILCGEKELCDVPFDSLRKGDIFFVNGDFFTVGQDAHYSGDASYDGYLLYDTDDNAWFPDDLDKGVKKYIITIAEESDYFIPNAVHVERYDTVFLAMDDLEAMDDFEAAKLAEADGVRLIYGLSHVVDGIYIDTEENRQIIAEMLQKHPEFLDIGCSAAAVEKKTSLTSQIDAARVRAADKGAALRELQGPER